MDESEDDEPYYVLNLFAMQMQKYQYRRLYPPELWLIWCEPSSPLSLDTFFANLQRRLVLPGRCWISSATMSMLVMTEYESASVCSLCNMR